MAVLFYGFALHADERSTRHTYAFPEDEVPDWIDSIDARWRKLSGQPALRKGAEVHSEEATEWRTALHKHNLLHGIKSALYGHENVDGINTHFFGDSESSTNYTCAKSVYVFDGDHAVLKPEDFVVSEDQIQKFKAYCEVVGIPWIEPAWILADQ